MTNLVSKKLKIKYQIVKDGKEAFKTKTYSKVRPEAEDTGLLQVAETIAGLQEKEVEAILKLEESKLDE